MRVLAIETATEVSSVAVGSEYGVQAHSMMARGRGHCEFLVPAIEQIFAQTGIRPSSLAGIAVGLGPGLFTGLRVGVTTAKTLAQALNTPIVGVASLDLLALQVRYSNRLICACLDAKRGEVFGAFYRQVPGGVQRVGAYWAWPPERIAAELQARPEEVLFVGGGALRYRDRLSGAHSEFASVTAAYPTADNLVELALPRLRREEFHSPLDLEPLYVRRSDAEINWERHGSLIRRPDRVRIPGSRGADGNGKERP